MPESGIAPKTIMGRDVSGRQGVKGVVFFWRGRGNAGASAGPPPKKSPPPALRAPLDGLSSRPFSAASRAGGKGSARQPVRVAAGLGVRSPLIWQRPPAPSPRELSAKPTEGVRGVWGFGRGFVSVKGFCFL